MGFKKGKSRGSRQRDLKSLDLKFQDSPPFVLGFKFINFGQHENLLTLLVCRFEHSEKILKPAHLPLVSSQNSVQWELSGPKIQSCQDPVTVSRGKTRVVPRLGVR